MYNEKSTETERRERLEDLLKRKATDEDSDDEIPDDEQINEMLSRNEEEFKAFEAMDAERYEIERKMYKHFKHPKEIDGKWVNYRLTTVDEVPEWVRVD